MNSAKICCGTDIINLRRTDAPWLSGKLLPKLYHAVELAHSTNQQRAGTFGIKEAAIKAFGLQPGDWLRMTVIRLPTGKPSLAIEGFEDASIDCSISHDGDYLVVMVVGLL